MRLIDADELKNVFEGYSYTENPNPHFPLDMVKKDIDDVPTVEAKEVVRSSWKYYRKQGIAVCKNCSFERKLDDDFGKAIACPNCGCDMRTSAE